MQVLHLFGAHFTGHHIYKRYFPFQNVLKILESFSHYVAAQIFCTAALLQWAIHRMELRSLDHFQGANTQLQITFTITCMCIIRRHCWSPLDAVIGKLASLVVFGRSLPIFDSQIVGHLNLLDISILTILGSHFLIPQSTSLFTNPCRPFTSPFPQCQDLLHTPPTYVMTFWMVLLVLYSTSIALDWFERGMPISFEWRRSHILSIDGCGRHFLLFALRLYILRNCFNFLMGEHWPHSPHFTNNSILFTPAIFFKSWTFSMSAGILLYILAIILRFGGPHLEVSSCVHALASRGTNTYRTLSTHCHTKVSCPSMTLASSDPIYSSSPKTPPRRSPGYYRRRSPLTPETFQPPQDSSHLACTPHSPASIEPSNPIQTPVDLADVYATQPEKIDLGVMNEECQGDIFVDTRDQKYRSLEFIVMKSGLPEDIESEFSDEDRLPFIRPPSRLAFNDDDTSPQWASLQIYEGDWETNNGSGFHRSTSNTTGKATFLFPAASLHDLEPPLTPDSSTTSSSSNLSRELAFSMPTTVSDKDPALHDDLDEYPTSPTRTSYDWMKAATFLQVTIGKEAGKVKRERVFHLARIPSLYTINEEATDDEADPSIDI